MIFLCITNIFVISYLLRRTKTKQKKKKKKKTTMKGPVPGIYIFLFVMQENRKYREGEIEKEFKKWGNI